MNNSIYISAADLRIARFRLYSLASSMLREADEISKIADLGDTEFKVAADREIARKRGDAERIKDIVKLFADMREVGSAIVTRYRHDCDKCEFLGKFQKYDIYFCNDHDPEGTIILRYGNDPEANRSTPVKLLRQIEPEEECYKYALKLLDSQ